MRGPRAGAARGFTILEMMIALVILAVIGGSLMRMLVAQTHLFEKSAVDRAARGVTRSAMNLIASDLRMVDANGGLVAASANTLVLRAPYAVGIVCGTTAGGTVVSLAPVDSTVWATAGLSGYAWRDTLGVYNYVEGGVTQAAGGAATCAAAGVTPLPNGRTVTVTPAMPADAVPSTPMLLEQRLRYEFKASGYVPGALGLWRTVVATGTQEELVAPFTSAAGFRFFALNDDSSQAAVPSPLADTRGIEFVLAARSERAPGGAAAPDSTLVTTAVFFRNRVN
jgi:prepilin-type N-terminal cleavage/methylation domain-containing protein